MYVFNLDFAITGFQKAAQFFAKLLPGTKPNKPVVELATKVQNLLFPSNHEVRIASASTELFVDVMAEFSKFENEVCCYIWNLDLMFGVQCSSTSSRVEIKLKPVRPCQCCWRNLKFLSSKTFLST